MQLQIRLCFAVIPKSKLAELIILLNLQCAFIKIEKKKKFYLISSITLKYGYNHL